MNSIFDKVGEMVGPGKTMLSNIAKDGKKLLEGDDTLKGVASTVLSSLATPVAWTDDALGHKVNWLGKTRDRLNALSREMSQATDISSGHTQDVASTSKTDATKADTGRESTPEPAKADTGRESTPEPAKADTGRESTPEPAKATSSAPAAASTTAQKAKKPESKTKTKAAASSPSKTSRSRKSASKSRKSSRASTSSKAKSGAKTRKTRTRRDSEMAVPDYDNLNAEQVLEVIVKLKAADIQDLMSYERATKNRRSVVQGMEKVLQGE